MLILRNILWPKDFKRLKHYVRLLIYVQEVISLVLLPEFVTIWLMLLMCSSKTMDVSISIPQFSLPVIVKVQVKCFRSQLSSLKKEIILKFHKIRKEKLISKKTSSKNKLVWLSQDNYKWNTFVLVCPMSTPSVQHSELKYPTQIVI